MVSARTVFCCLSVLGAAGCGQQDIIGDPDAHARMAQARASRRVLVTGPDDGSAPEDLRSLKEMERALNAGGAIGVAPDGDRSVGPAEDHYMILGDIFYKLESIQRIASSGVCPPELAYVLPALDKRVQRLKPGDSRDLMVSILEDLRRARAASVAERAEQRAARGPAALPPPDAGAARDPGLDGGPGVAAGSPAAGARQRMGRAERPGSQHWLNRAAPKIAELGVRLGLVRADRRPGPGDMRPDTRMRDAAPLDPGPPAPPEPQAPVLPPDDHR